MRGAPLGAQPCAAHGAMARPHPRPSTARWLMGGQPKPLRRRAAARSSRAAASPRQPSRRRARWYTRCWSWAFSDVGPIARGRARNPIRVVVRRRREKGLWPSQMTAGPTLTHLDSKVQVWQRACAQHAHVRSFCEAGQRPVGRGAAPRNIAAVRTTFAVIGQRILADGVEF